MTKEAQTLRQPMIDRVNQLLVNKFKWLNYGDLRPDRSLLDHLAMVDYDVDILAVAIDQEFDIDIPWKDWDDVKTLADLYKLVEQNVDMNEEADNEATNARK